MRKKLVRSTGDLERMIARSSAMAGEERLLPMSFADSLVRIMKREKVSRSQLAALSGVSEATIGRMRCNDEICFSKQKVIAICVALRLDPAEAFSLIEKAGCSLRLTCAQETAYFHVLCNCGMHSVDEINCILTEKGFDPIGG